ncbi:MAG: glycosyl transferase group 1 [Candidatus Angelobacter sp.]|jgi:glycosyltransferase involved in cell wall biosynthesis|nr:glycosyl transferase group 1 [Candidatus Angelobacter sp.]
MPRRVLHILSDADWGGTGIARIVSAIAHGIDPQRYEISACFVGTAGPLFEEFQKQGIPTSLIKWRHPHRDPAGLFRLWWRLRKEQFDVVHLHWGGRGVRWTIRNACSPKLVFHLHGQITEHDLRRHTASSTAGVDAVIAVSQAVAQHCLSGNTKIVYSGVDIPEDLTRHSSPEITIGTAGRLIPIKGINYLLRAMSLLKPDFPHLRLEIAGVGPESSNLKDEVASLGLEANVTFLGWISDPLSKLSQWTAFIQPSVEEGLPIAVLEAMATGLPVVASAVGGLPEIVDDGKTGRLVPPADPVSLANAIRELLLDPVNATNMGNAGRARVMQEFSSRKMVNEVLSIYDDLFRL